MGITKNHIHTEEQIELARLFKALGHPARIAIIENIMKHKNLNCNDLRSYIQLAQSTISGHIKQLHEAGILAVCVIENNAYYVPNKTALGEITSYLKKIFQKLDTIIQQNVSMLYTRPLLYKASKKWMNQT